MYPVQTSSLVEKGYPTLIIPTEDSHRDTLRKDLGKPCGRLRMDREYNRPCILAPAGNSNGPHSSREGKATPERLPERCSYLHLLKGIATE